MKRENSNKSDRVLKKNHRSTTSSFFLMDQFSSRKVLKYAINSPTKTTRTNINNTKSSFNINKNLSSKKLASITSSNFELTRNSEKNIKLPDLMLKNTSSPKLKKSVKHFYVKSEFNDPDHDSLCFSPDMFNINQVSPKFNFKDPQSFLCSPKSKDPLMVQNEFNKSAIWKDLKQSKKKMVISDKSTFTALVSKVGISANNTVSNNLYKNTSEMIALQDTLKSSPHQAKFTDTTDKLDHSFRLFDNNGNMLSSFNKLASKIKFGAAESLSEMAGNSTLEKNNRYNTSQDIIEMLEGNPKSFNFVEKSNFYIYIRCKSREFPAYIVCDKKCLQIKYHINFVSRDYNVKASSKNIFMVNKSPVSQIKPAFEVKMNNQVRPSEFSNDLALTGDYIQVDYAKSNLIKEKLLNKECEILLIEIVSPVAIRASFTITFSNIIQKKHLDFEVFSKLQKEELFNDMEEDEVIKEIKTIKEKKNENSWQIKSNINMTSSYNEIKQKKLDKSVKNLEERTQNAMKKFKENHKETIWKRQQFQLKNAFFKYKAKLACDEKVRFLNLFMQMYFWCFMIKFTKCMTTIHRKFVAHRKAVLFEKATNEYASRIQKTYRFKMTFVKPKAQRNREIVSLAMGLRCIFNGKRVFNKAEKAAGKFLKEITAKQKIKNDCLQFIQLIKNMQKRMKSHMTVKKEFIIGLENQWQRQICYIGDNLEKFLQIGFEIKLEHLQYVSREIRRKICIHIFNRQLQRYIDTKYEQLEKTNDIEIEKKAIKLSENPKLKKRLSKFGIIDSLQKNASIKDNIDSEQTFEFPGKKQLSELDSIKSASINSSFDEIEEKDIFDKKPNSKNELQTITESKIDQHNQPNEIETPSGNHQPQNQEDIPLEQSSKREISGKLKEKNNIDVDIEKSFLQRVANRNRRQSDMIQNCNEVHRKSIKMLLKSSKKNYVYNSTKFWEFLDLTSEAEIFRNAIKRAPEIVEAKLQYKRFLVEEERKNLLEEQKILRKNTLQRKKTVITKIKKITKPEAQKPPSILPSKPNTPEESLREIFSQMNINNMFPSSSGVKFDCELDDETMQAIIIATMEHCSKMNLFQTGINSKFASILFKS